MAAFHFPHCYDGIDPTIRRDVVDFHAADGFPLSGFLHRPSRVDSDVAVLAMHPRVDFSRHYLAPRLAAGGYAFFGAHTRYLNHDADALHERLLLDVAGAVTWLRSTGFRRVILLGNSGGGSLFAFYLAQAGRAPAERIDRAPSGDRVPLSEIDMPGADGLVLLAAHPGEGRFLLDRLDPSVVDEADPIACDPGLDMYDPQNGYRPMREGPSSYSSDFVAAFRAGQRERCRRLDAIARGWCEEAAWARQRLRETGSAATPMLVRRAHQRRYVLIYRTLADPRYLDLSLDPSPRPLGSIFSFGRDPVVANAGEGLARTMSARGWLSTWSGLSSHASLESTLPETTIPTLSIAALGDMDVYPANVRRAHEASAAADKTYAELPNAGHYLQPVLPLDGEMHPRMRVTEEIILPWLRGRWQP